MGTRSIWKFAVVLALSGVGSTALPAEPAANPRLGLQELRAQYGDARGRIATIKGIEVYYKDEGRGPAILMVHGSRSSLSTWDRVAPLLTKRYRVIRFDIPPYGLSGPIPDDVAANLRPTDIPEGLLAQLQVDRIAYVGVSSGGTLGVQLAARRPELVQRLILSNTPADPVRTDHLKPSAEFLEAQRVARDSGFESQQFWNLFFDFFSGDPRRIDARIRRKYYDFNRRVPEKNVLAATAVVADHERAVAAMAGVKAPTLLIWGGSDPLLVPASADKLAGYLTGAQVSKVWMADVGHYPPLESPERYAQILAAYLEAAAPWPR